MVQTVTAAVIVGVLAALGIDPLVGVFGSMAGVATVGMVLLMLATSVAVLAYFVRHRELSGGRVWQTRIAPATGLPRLDREHVAGADEFHARSPAVARRSSAALAAIPFVGLVVGALLWRPSRSLSETSRG